MPGEAPDMVEVFSAEVGAGKNKKEVKNLVLGTLTIEI